jgi:superfamily II DNA or RNA helicase
MGLYNLNLKYAYDSSIDDVLNEFYIPVLSNSVVYKRLVGYFSSNSLAIAAKGISRFIKNGGRMKIIAGAHLMSNDIESIVRGVKDPISVIEESFIKSITEITDEFVRDHIKALAWMVANDKLEIKIALPNIEENDNLEYTTGIFHQKIGILEDNEGYMLSFSGSINETADAWTNNIEEFKVFKSWIGDERKFLEEDNKKFESYWKGESKKIKIYDVPTAVKDRLIKVLDDDIENIIKRLESYYSNIRPKQIIDIKTSSYGSNSYYDLNQLRDYQKRAIESWFNKEMHGIIEMATGTGKTHVAVGVIKEIEKRQLTNKIVVVITVPYNYLITQWKEILEKWRYDNIYEIHASNYNKYNKLGDVIWSSQYKNITILITTHDTFYRDKIINVIKEINDNGVPILLIADEVHGLGSPKRRKGLLQYYKYKLGLSATPIRHFDEEGTNVITTYFGNTIFKYTLKKAIEQGYLTPYYYYPCFVELTDRESQKYSKLTKEISKIWNSIISSKNNDKVKEAKSLIEEVIDRDIDMDININTAKADVLEKLKHILIRRNKILVNAEKKLSKFEDILDNQLTQGDYDSIRHTLVYCSPEQIDKVQDILNKRNIIQHKITAEESKGDRERILKDFESGTYQVLVAMKVLDEGVDIPAAHTAILLASSTNPREFIQRRGRVLRRYPGKAYATIYDICVRPRLSGTDIDDIEKGIIDKELKRIMEFAESSKNPDYTSKELTKAQEGGY